MFCYVFIFSQHTKYFSLLIVFLNIQLWITKMHLSLFQHYMISQSQEQFLIGIQDMISRRTGTPTHLFHDTLQCLAKLKEMVREFRHVSDREAGRKIRREWLQRQRGRQVMLMLIGVVYVISLVVFWNNLCYVHLLRQF
jgi:hypothetical protein